MSYLALGVGVVLAVLVLPLVALVLKRAHSRPGGDGRHHHGPVERVVLLTVTRLLRAGLRVGIHVGPMMMLTIRGYRSGQPRTNPVDLWTGGGRSYLVATHTATAAWVRNLRAAGEGVLWRGRRRWTFTATELTPLAGAAMIQDVLVPRMRRPLAGFVLRQTVPVPAGATRPDLIEVARTHPVFEVTLTEQTRAAATADHPNRSVKETP